MADKYKGILKVIKYPDPNERPTSSGRSITTPRHSTQFNLEIGAKSIQELNDKMYKILMIVDEDSFTEPKGNRSND